MNTFITDISKQTISIDGVKYDKETLYKLNENYGDKNKPLVEFLYEWFNDSTTIKVHTSGSTGTPKELWVEKKRMINSAIMTVTFLGLKKGDSALLCMPLQYIAGKMVVVRALVAGLDIIPVIPCGRPMKEVTGCIPDFAAMIPMQVYNSLKYENDRLKLMQVKHLIIGGGAVDENLTLQLQQFPNSVWSTYGMTETLSHIALRKINGEDASQWYTPFGNIRLSLNDEGTLIIEAPSLNPEILTTNDIVKFNDKGQFCILGRKDNTINTGGVKVQIEQVESELKKFLVNIDFTITSVPDEKFGERIVMLTSAQEGNSNQDIIKAIENLPAYWRPKNILYTELLPLTGTGKPDRANAKKIAKRLLSS